MPIAAAATTSHTAALVASWDMSGTSAPPPRGPAGRRDTPLRCRPREGGKAVMPISPPTVVPCSNTNGRTSSRRRTLVSPSLEDDGVNGENATVMHSNISGEASATPTLLSEREASLPCYTTTGQVTTWTLDNVRRHQFHVVRRRNPFIEAFPLI